MYSLAKVMRIIFLKLKRIKSAVCLSGISYRYRVAGEISLPANLCGHHKAPFGGVSASPVDE